MKTLLAAGEEPARRRSGQSTPRAPHPRNLARLPGHYSQVSKPNGKTLGWPALLVTAALSACGSGEDNGETPDASPAALPPADEVKQTPVSTVAPPPLASSSGLGTRATGGLGASEPPSMLGVDEACAGESVGTERLPLDMYFLVDTSGSMAQPVGAGSKWELVRDALLSFLRDTDNADVGVGIGYFPNAEASTCSQGDPDCTCLPFAPICYPTGGRGCEVADYAQPVVPLSLTPQHAAIETDLTARNDNLGGTPTLPAVQGAMEHLETWATSNPGRRVVLVLATDGEPTGCEGNSPEAVAQIAGDALNGPNQIQTFVIGVGGALSSLNLVAQAGGTTQAFLTDANANLAQGFADALGRIRTSALPCEYAIPTSSTRGAIDPFQVNVLLSGAGNAAPAVLPQVTGDADCNGGMGWFYNDPAAPTSIQLCQASCQASEQARIELLFGCETVIAPLR